MRTLIFLARRMARIVRDRQAATLTEFALILPVFAMMLMGIFDMGYNVYAAGILQGAIHEAARDGSIEGSTPAALDANVAAAVRNIAPNASITTQRKSYTSLSDVGRPEDFDDANANGQCDAGELFTDTNGNGTFDTDRGRLGSGGARDAVEYIVTVSYPRSFPIARLAGLPATVSLTSRTILRNQPFNQQALFNQKGNCL